MSVDVKTPTRTQFEHKEFPCGGAKTPTGPAGGVTVTVSATATELVAGGSGPECVENAGQEVNGKAGQSRGFKHDRNANQHGRPGYYKFESAPGGRVTRKRRHSERPAVEYRHEKSAQYKRGRFGKFRGNERIVLPTKFLLGGNISDPLNLNSLCDEEVNRALNEKTPQSSPLPVPAHRKQVEVLIPPNITDPLNLNSGEDVDLNLLSPKSGSKKKRGPRHKKKRSIDATRPDEGNTSLDQSSDVTKPVHVDVGLEASSINVASTATAPKTLDVTSDSQGFGNKLRKVIDKIVSPVIPQTSPKSWRKKRASSDGKETSCAARAILLGDESTEKLIKTDKSSPVKPKYRRQGNSHQSVSHSKKPNQNQKFIYGNYNRYYGYRNPGQDSDERLKVFQPEWFFGRDVLDIGCNVGHVTLSVARDFSPKKIIGVDIDSTLIKAAKNNIRHYLASEKVDTSKFPASMRKMYGPIAAPPMHRNKEEKEECSFPNNVHFVQGNYVLDRDELLDLQREEYDVILALSLTKWIHLNFGDDGLKRTLKRMFKQLRPGGKLILEPQSWSSYKKKKKLTDRIFKNYQAIRMRPDQFTEYLLSREVGFSTCIALKMPFNKAKGFQRPLQVFTKADTAYVTPNPYPWSSNATPVPGTFEDSRGYTPKFLIGSGPGTPSLGWSAVSSRTQSPETVQNSGATSGTTSKNPTPDGTTPCPESGSPSPAPRPLQEVKCCSAPSLLETCTFNATGTKIQCSGIIESKEDSKVKSESTNQTAMEVTEEPPGNAENTIKTEMDSSATDQSTGDSSQTQTVTIEEAKTEITDKKQEEKTG